jgi:phosphatidylethanolamine-binding protein (PEBP) family uncharacterized protein
MNAIPESWSRQIQRTKLEFVHWVLDEISQGTTMTEGDIARARDYVEDVREDYFQGVNNA